MTVHVLCKAVEGGEAFPEASFSKHPAGNPLTLLLFSFLSYYQDFLLMSLSCLPGS